MVVKFDDIHRTVLDAISHDERDCYKLKIIADWYYKFLISEQNEVRLILPFYERDFTKLLHVYIRYFSFIYNLVRSQELKSFNDTCLFDIFSYEQRKNNSPETYFLKFSGSSKDILIWDNNIITKTNCFLPVFSFDEVKDIGVNVFANTFSIYKAIRKNNLITHPVKVELSQYTLVLINGDDLSSKSILNVYDEIHDPSDSSEIEVKKATVIKTLNANNQLVLRYPYHREIKQWYIKRWIKTFEIIFYSRFHYKLEEFLPSDLIILPTEIDNKSTILVDNPFDRYLIYNTEHNNRIYELFHNLKEEWRHCEFNKWTSPFPKYWFMFINPIATVDEWIRLFERNYPAASQRPIMNTIKNLIVELHGLNWIKKFIQCSDEDICLIFPEIVGNQTKILKEAYYRFEKYVKSINNTVLFLTEPNLSNKKKNYYLNGFDICESANLLQNYQQKSFKFLIPDFSFNSYNPGLIYQTFSYQSQVLKNKIRETVDSNYNVNKIKLEDIDAELKNKSNAYSKNYKKKYRNINAPEDDFGVKNAISLEDIELTNDEENDTYLNSNNKGSELNPIFVLIQITGHPSIQLKSTEKIFVYRNSLISIDSKMLEKGDLFFTNDDISKLISQNDFFDKLSDIPERVKGFQTELYNIPNSYKELELMGLNYVGGNAYFEKYYSLKGDKYDNESFLLPRKRKYWKIICDYLGIETNDMSLAFISYYGRTRRNNIKELYKSIFNYLIENNSIGEMHSSKTVNAVSKILENYIEIFRQVEDLDFREIAVSVLGSIDNELLNLIKEVREIKYIKHEQI